MLRIFNIVMGVALAAIALRWLGVDYPDAVHDAVVSSAFVAYGAVCFAAVSEARTHRRRAAARR